MPIQPREQPHVGSIGRVLGTIVVAEDSFFAVDSEFECRQESEERAKRPRIAERHSPSGKHDVGADIPWVP